ncbi:hypothetical protein BDN72DRAFT_151944 [Pluteus cervinus]|uniref:Uncharacterized protein n=1 Tax=Pluteus cervinus TaxID=181527 RepID=A0ACD3B7Z0_9AGAR|nr:hypothetical protein BDN72DRAFT_151944 [Pluteus cervinus]
MFSTSSTDFTSLCLTTLDLPQLTLRVSRFFKLVSARRDAHCRIRDFECDLLGSCLSSLVTLFDNSGTRWFEDCHKPIVYFASTSQWLLGYGDIPRFDHFYALFLCPCSEFLWFSMVTAAVPSALCSSRSELGYRRLQPRSWDRLGSWWIDFIRLQICASGYDDLCLVKQFPCRALGCRGEPNGTRLIFLGFAGYHSSATRKSMDLDIVTQADPIEDRCFIKRIRAEVLSMTTSPRSPSLVGWFCDVFVFRCLRNLPFGYLNCALDWLTLSMLGLAIFFLLGFLGL